MATDALKRAIKKYDAANTMQIHLKLNIKTDADIIEHLSKQESKQGYIKELIRDDMGNNGKPYLVEKVIEIENGSESYSFHKYCPSCRVGFGWFYPPNFCPKCGQKIDKEHSEDIGTKTIDKRTKSGDS